MARPRNISDEQILEAARECFLEHGPGLSTTVIASCLGISHALLFQRFGTKEELMRAALLPKVDHDWIEHIRSGPDARGGRIQIREIAEQVFALFQAMVPRMMVIRSAGFGPQIALEKPEDLPQVRTRREVEAWFDRAASRGLVRPVSPAHFADLLLGALMIRPFQQHVGRSVYTPSETGAFVEFVVNAVWNAVRPVRQPSPPARAARARSK